MLEVCALYNLYDEDFWLPYSVASIYNVVPKIFCILNENAWYGPVRDQTNTRKCVESLADPDNKIKIIEGSWSSEVEQRNFNLVLTAQEGFAACLIIDADELYHQNQLQAMFSLAEQNSDVDCWHINWVTYWKSVRHRIDPIEQYQPVVLMRPGSCYYVETRNPVGKKHALIPPECAICHHMSYALPDERIARKHISFSGHSQSAYEGWMEGVWRAWDNNKELTNLHPNVPSHFQRAVAVPKEILPPVVWPLYDGKGLP